MKLLLLHRCKIPSNWSKYKAQRNIVTKLRRKSRAQSSIWQSSAKIGKEKLLGYSQPLFNQKYIHNGTDIDLTLTKMIKW